MSDVALAAINLAKENTMYDLMAAAERLDRYDLAHFQGPTERDADMRAGIACARAIRLVIEYARNLRSGGRDKKIVARELARMLEE